MAHRGSGAPLVSITLMAHQLMVRHYYIVMAHQVSGAPLVAISSIALFLVVWSPWELCPEHTLCVCNLSSLCSSMVPNIEHGRNVGNEWWERMPPPPLRKIHDQVSHHECKVIIEMHERSYAFRVDAFSYKKLFHRRSYAKVMSILQILERFCKKVKNSFL